MNLKSRRTFQGTGKHLWLLLICFFFSGATGIIYEILWTRMIVKIAGSAPFTISIILTIFMAGLAAGSYFSGRISDRLKPRALVFGYGLLEIITGIYCLLLPLLITLSRPFFAAAYNEYSSKPLIFAIITLTGSFFLLILPSLSMGATFPVLSRFIIRRHSKTGSGAGILYGINTIGAAAGAMVCGFWLIALYGVNFTLYLAVAVNLIIGILCIFTAVYIINRDNNINDRENEYSPAYKKTERDPLFSLILFTVAVSGFSTMGYEVMWTRLVALIIAPTTYSFTTILVIFITGLAAGSYVFGKAADRSGSPALLLALTQIAAALTALAASHYIGNSQIFFAKLIFHFKDSFAILSALKFLALFLLMFLPPFFSGAAFPIAAKLITKSAARTGKSMGFIYMINSAGGVAGSFFTGLILISFLTRENCIGFLVIAQLLTALLLFLKSCKKKITAGSLLIPAVAVSGIFLAFFYPDWDRKILSVGKYLRVDKSFINRIGWTDSLFKGKEKFARTPEYLMSSLLYYGDGPGGFTSVFKIEETPFSEPYFSICNYGKPDASSHLDMATQTSLAHIPMLFHKKAKDVLVLGLASGITAGEVLNYPVKSIDILEINHQVAAASRFFSRWNSNILKDERTELLLQDARTHFELTRKKYDVVISEPSNPWMNGLSALFTADFFKRVENTLNPDGIFCQWIHAYEMSWEDFSMIGRTFARVFPAAALVRTFPETNGPDLLLVGFKDGNIFNEANAKNNLKFASRSKNMRLLNHRLYYEQILSDDLLKLFGKGPINTDGHPFLEYSAPRKMYQKDPASFINAISKLSVGKRIEAIKKSLNKDPKQKIDAIEFSLSLNLPMPLSIEIGSPGERQEERLATILFRHYSTRFEQNFPFDENIRLYNASLKGQIRFFKSWLAARSIDIDKKEFSKTSEKTICFAINRLADLNLELKRYNRAIDLYQKSLSIGFDNAKTLDKLTRASEIRNSMTRKRKTAEKDKG